MADTSGLVTIKQIVNGFIFKSGIELKYFMIYQLACDIIRELNLWILNDSKRVVKLTMNLNSIVDLPDDYLRFCSVSIPRDGKYWTLTRDDGIITTTTEVDGSEVLDSDYGEGVDIEGNAIHNYGSTLINPHGYYTLDERNRRIVFRNLTRSEVFLTYVSSGLNTEEETLVPVTAKPAIEAWIMLELAIYNNAPASRISMLKDRYEAAESRLIGLQLPTIKDFEDAFYKEINQTIKR